MLIVKTLWKMHKVEFKIPIPWCVVRNDFSCRKPILSIAFCSLFFVEKCVNPPECKNGGFLNSDCKCNCPYGLTGDNCDSVINSGGNVNWGYREQMCRSTPLVMLSAVQDLTKYFILNCWDTIKLNFLIN